MFFCGKTECLQKVFEPHFLNALKNFQDLVQTSFFKLQSGLQKWHNLSEQIRLS